MTTKKDQQLIHLVFGGELSDVSGVTFKDLAHLDVVGFYPNYAAAFQAWQDKARETIDNASRSSTSWPIRSPALCIFCR